MPLFRNTITGALVVALLTTVAPPLLWAQPVLVPYETQSYPVDSGVHRGDGQEFTVPFRRVIRAPGAPWLRLGISDYDLGSQSYITTTSLEDGSSQRLNAHTLPQSRNGTASLPARGSAPDPETPYAKAIQRHREERRDPYLPTPLQPRERRPPLAIVEGPFVSVQVNVDDFGNNIVGDAANEPSIAVDPNDPNKMAIGWRQFDNINSDFRQAGWAHSHDAGQTWTFPGVLNPGEFSSDPVLDSDAQGRFYYYSLQPERGPGEWACYMYRSDDGGVTWPQEVYAFGGDKGWFTIDRTDGPGRGYIYAAWSVNYACCGLNIFNRSTNGGLSFSAPVPIENSPRWGTLSVGPDGQVYVAGGLGAGANHFVAKSTNANDPMQTPAFHQVVEVDLGGATVLRAGSNPGGLLGQLWVATDHSEGRARGNVYALSSVDPPGDDPLDVMFARSTNGGLTFSPPVRVNDDPAGNGAWQWFGTMSVAPNGRIDAFWNDTRNSGAVNFSQVFYTFSIDTGLTWSDNVAVTPLFDSHIGWPHNQSKIGDYYHSFSDNDGVSLAYAATFNGEQDIYHVRVDPAVWVDFAYDGPEEGTFDRPYDTIMEGVDAAPVRGIVLVKAGVSTERPTITKAVTILSFNGSVTIGQ